MHSVFSVKPIEDTFSWHGADTLASRIRAFWSRRDYAPKVWIEKQGDIYAVRSDMVGGRPT